MKENSFYDEEVNYPKKKLKKSIKEPENGTAIFWV
tara:strand:+ start:341 stop:445 length:105 start_codon:yes stop_codon:yes gene_type:complete